MTKPIVSAERLRELLHYDPETGVFTRLKASGGGEPAGSIAGWLDKSTGYVRCNLDGICYRVHRLAWLYMTGEWPADQIDHINGERADNRFANLREATNAQNVQNRRKQRNNTSGYPGVSWFQTKWQAHIRINGKLKHLGCFDNPKTAHDAYLKAKREHHPFCPGSTVCPPPSNA